MTKKYNLCFDVLTILACLMVVFFHCNGVIYSFSDTTSWKISVMVRCVVYSAIPIFFMLTGAKLFDYRSRYTTKEYIKKRLMRVGIPFLFWNLFYVIYNRILTPENSPGTIKEFVSKFLNSEFQSRFWFFWPLFAIYLAIPLLSLVLSSENHRKYLWFAVYASFSLSFLLRPILYLLGIEHNSYIDFPVSAGFMTYVIFGYLVSTEKWSLPKRLSLYALALLSGVFAVWFTITESVKTGNTYQAMLSYEFFPSALTGGAIFVFVKNLFDKSPRLGSISSESKTAGIVRTVSGACMGIWLTHSLAIKVLLILLPLDHTGYVFRFLCPFLIFALCLFGVLILKKIPFLRHIV